MSGTIAKRMRERHADDQFRLVIGGVLYDTATASLLAQSWYDETIEYQVHGPQHPDDVGEKLYVNRWGVYFLYVYADRAEWETAIAWAEKHLATDDIIDIFGPLKEAGEA